MIVAEKVLEKEFTAKDTKTAYKIACRWVASNIIAVNNSENLTYSIEKGTMAKNVSELFGVVTLKVFVTADETEIKNRHCAICNEASSLLYIKAQQHKCEYCKMNPYRTRLKDKLKAVKDSLKGVII